MSAALALLAVASGAFAQLELDRRGRDEPEVILNHGGRSGFCDALRWDAAGKYLFAAGDDKEVTVWPVLLDDSKAPRLNTDRAAVQHLRWPAWREQGGIKAIAVAPAGDKVAVGGFGLIPSAVAVISRTETTAAESVVLAYTWPRARTGKNADNFGTVTAVAFAEDGKRVAFGTADGGVWVWDTDKPNKPVPQDLGDAAPREWAAPVRAGKHALPAGGNAAELPARSRLLFFRGKDTVVSVSNSGEVLAFDVSGRLSDDPADPVPGPKEKLFHLNKDAALKREVYRAELTPDGKGVCVAFKGPSVGVFGLADQGKGVELDLGDDRMAWGVAVEPGTGRLAVAVGGARPGDGKNPRFFLERENEVWVYDAVKANAKPAAVLPVGRAEAVAFHPKRKGLVAVAGGDADEVRLFDVDGKAAVPTSTAVGVGRRITAVGIVSGTEVAVKVLPDPAAAHPNADARGPWITYDLSRQRTVAGAKEPSAARNEADGWKVTPDDAKNPQRHRWHAVGPGGQRALLAFDHAQYNDPTCYTFIPAGDGGPTRLLVGHTYGCSLYELPAPGKDVPAELRPAAVYVGHQAQVLSVAASADGTWFVTGGADHTVAAFTLKAWAHHPYLGAAFEPTRGKAEVVVTDVAVGSPAWEAGLVKGEKLTRVGVFGRGQKFDSLFNTKKEPGWPVAGTPKEAEEAAGVLNGPLLPGREVYLETAGPKGDRVRKTSLQQRPVWKWFPAFDRPADATAPPTEVKDSVVWMWNGSKYLSAAAQGDLLAGWHVNPAKVFGSPYYYPLPDRNKRYSDPDLIRQLLRTRDVPAALAAAWGKNPTPQALSITAHEPVPLKLQLPKLEVNAGSVAVRATLDLTELAGQPDLLPNELEVWVNDYRKVRLSVPPARDQPFSTTVDLHVSELRAGENTVTAIARNRAGGRVRNAALLTNTNPPPANPLLVGWVGGLNGPGAASSKQPAALRAAIGDLPPLKFAVPDARAFRARFDVNCGAARLYRENQLKLKTDGGVSRKSLFDELERLARAGAVKPDDTLVLFLAGHGVLIGDHKGKRVTTMVPRDEKDPEGTYDQIRFAFCGVEFDPLDPKGTGVPADELFDLLVRINCRKLVFLDVCHAGGAVETDIIRQMLPEGQGPFVFAACGWGERPWEVGDEKGEHGLFTSALLEATGDQFHLADADKSNDLSCKELADYCTRRVRELRLKAMKKGGDKNAIRSAQNPEHNLETTGMSRVVVFRRPR